MANISSISYFDFLFLKGKYCCVVPHYAYSLYGLVSSVFSGTTTSFDLESIYLSDSLVCNILRGDFFYLTVLLLYKIYRKLGLNSLIFSQKVLIRCLLYATKIMAENKTPKIPSLMGLNFLGGGGKGKQ